MIELKCKKPEEVALRVEKLRKVVLGAKKPEEVAIRIRRRGKLGLKRRGLAFSLLLAF